MKSYKEYLDIRWEDLLKASIAQSSKDCLEIYDIKLTDEEFEDFCAAVYHKYVKYDAEINYAIYEFAKAYCQDMQGDDDYKKRVLKHKETQEDIDEYYWRLGQ